MVDDSIEFVKRMKGLLLELTVVKDVKTATSYEEAAKMLTNENPDLVLLDIHLPGKSGIELLKFIKQLEKLCKIMIVSNQADEYYRRLCKSLGADYFFDKTKDFLRIPELIQKM